IFAVSAIVALAFPFAARADLVGTVTLVTGDRYSFDIGVTYRAGSVESDIQWSRSVLRPDTAMTLDYVPNGKSNDCNKSVPVIPLFIRPHRASGLARSTCQALSGSRG